MKTGKATTVLETKNGQKLLHGTWIDMHDAPVTFNARKYHMLEKHRGNMWALAAYTLQAFSMLGSFLVAYATKAQVILVAYAAWLRSRFSFTSFPI